MPGDVKWRPTAARADWRRCRLLVDLDGTPGPYLYRWRAAAFLRSYASGRARTFAAACRAAERAARKMEAQR